MYHFGKFNLVNSHNSLGHWSTNGGRMANGVDLSRNCDDFGGGVFMDGGAYAVARAGTGSVRYDLDCYHKTIQEK